MNNKQKSNNSNIDDEIDLLALASIMLDYKWLIAGVTVTFALLSLIYVLLATPIYQATALIQIESKKSSMAGLESMTDLLGQESDAITEIEIIKSRMIIGKAVDNLKLDIEAHPKNLPVIGSFIERRLKPTPPETTIAAPLNLFSSYNWGGAEISIFELQLPDDLMNEQLILTHNGDGKFSLSYDDNILLTGKVGEPAEANGIRIQVEKLQANVGTDFIVSKMSRLKAIIYYQGQLIAAERSKQSGMIGLSLEHSNPATGKNILNEFARLYVQQNVERTSAEAANSLEFLQQQLPQVRLEMEKAEALLNEYQISAKSANITIETQAVLNQVVDLETSLSNLRLKQLEMDKKFTKEHPAYQTLLNQINTLESDKQILESKVKSLPETQQELLRLARNVKVSSEIYTQMLQKAQELDITRASAIGNVRIIDDADVDVSSPVSPARTATVFLSTLLGAALSIFAAFVHNVLHRGIENPADIENLGLPVYASVPFSTLQSNIQKNSGQLGKPLLAYEYPTDPSLEAIRNLNTSLHFAMLEAKNNIIMISGPSPAVGKSFISANLAALMSQAGKKVLLIDADMRRGHLHKFFDTASNEHGLSHLLARQNELNEVVRDTMYSNLKFIPRGPIPPNPSELLLNKYFAELMQQLSHQYDSVIIDTPPLLAVSDAITIGKVAGTNFIVARFNKTALGELSATIKQFEQNGITLNGSILNGFHKKMLLNYNYQYIYEADKSSN